MHNDIHILKKLKPNEDICRKQKKNSKMLNNFLNEDNLLSFVNSIKII